MEAALAIVLMRRQRNKAEFMTRRRKIVASVLYGIQARDSMRTRNYIERQALVHPKDSPWAQLDRSRSDPSLICTTGFDFACFDFLVRAVERELARRAALRPPKGPGGRKPMLNTRARVALVLHWLAGSCQVKHLMLIFGAGAAVVSRALNSMQTLLLTVLNNMIEASIVWPDKVRACVRVRLPIACLIRSSLLRCLLFAGAHASVQ